MNDDVEIPEDTRRSRLNKPGNEAVDEEFVRAEDRFARFRRQHPEGGMQAALERVIEHADGHLTYVVQARAWSETTALGAGGRQASAWAQGSTKSSNPVIAGSPLESAETIALSRALRNLGILPKPKKAKS